MEVFVAYSEDQQIPLLEQTMETWAGHELMEPVGVRAPAGKYELVRRISADNMAEGDYYILADLGCIPGEKFDVHKLMERLHTEPEMPEEYGLIGFGKDGHELARRPVFASAGRER